MKFQVFASPLCFSHGREHGHDHEHDHHHGPHGRPGFGHFRHRMHGGFGEGHFGDRMRRGGMKFAVLAVLADGPRHGYEILTEIEARRGHRPSAGAIYPVLQMLEDRGLVTSTETDGKRVYTITEGGLALHGERGEDESEPEAQDDVRVRVKTSIMRLRAAFESMRGASDAELEQTIEILDRARRDIHRLLAGDEAAP